MTAKPPPLKVVESAAGPAAWLIVAIALGPFLANWWAKVILAPRPFFVQFCDPELIYYFNGLRLLRGQLPIYVHSPGTLVVVLSAAIKGLVGGDVLDPTASLRVGYALGLVATVGATWLLVRGPLANCSRSAQLLAISVFFASPAAFSRSDVWSAEMFSFAAGALAIVAAWKVAAKPGGRRELLLLGLAVGLACSFKMTFLPWLIGGAVLVLGAGGSRLRALALYLSGVAAAFVLATLPVAGRYGEMFGWFGQVATHAGRYGAGGVGVPDPAALGHAGVDLLAAAKGWHAVLAVVLVGLARGLWSRRKGDPDRLPVTLVLAFGAALVLGYGLYLKQPAVHYLIPVATAGMALAVAAALPLELWLGPRRLAVLAALVFLVAGRGALQDWQTHQSLVGWGAEQVRELAAFVAREGPRDRPARVLYGWRFPTPEFALGFFSVASADLDLSAELEARYPNAGADIFGERRFPTGRDWDYLVIGQLAVDALPPGSLRMRLETEAERQGPWRILRQP